MNVSEAYKKMLTNRGGSVNGSDILNSKSAVIKGFKSDPSYKNAILIKDDFTEQSIDIRIINVDKTTSEKKFHLMPDTFVKIGDYIKYDIYDNNNVLIKKKTFIVEEFENNLISPYSKVLECNQTLNLKGWDKPIPCVASNDSYGVKLNESVLQFSFRDAKMKVQVQKNSITKTIKNGTRFIFDNSEDDIYRVIDKSSAISSNIIIFMLEKVETMVGDDFVNNIACNDIVPDISTTFSITGVENIKIGTQQTFTLQPISTGITWEIDDLTIGEIISQDSTSCIIQGKGTTDELLTLNAIQNSVIIVTKYINITTR